MIPERDDLWLLSAPPRSLPAAADAASAASASPPDVGPHRLLLPLVAEPTAEAGSLGRRRGATAWGRYREFARALEARGESFDRKLLVEAMFRGSNLVYSAGVS